MSLRNFQRSRSRQISTACLEALEDRRLLSFSPAVNYATAPATPSAIVTADFNNDGKLDLATCANAYTGSFSVLLGNGAGGFGAAQRTIIGSQLTSMAVADFNSDGNVDIVAANWGASVLHLLKGNGDGTFQPSVDAPQWKFLEWVAVGHFNNDNHADLLVNLSDWDSFDSIYQVQLGDGQGGFRGSDTDPWVWDVNYPYAGGMMATADLNNDGKLDVVNADVDVFVNSGNGALQNGSHVPVLGWAVATGDFTGDGKADVISVGRSVLAVLRGRGDGSFDPPLLHTANGTRHSAVATADFNADGKLDAIVTDNDIGTASVMLGNGDGTLRYFGAFATGTSPSGVAVGDFNGDGRPDAAVSNAGFYSRDVSVLLNDGDWLTTPPPPPAPPEISISDVTVTEGDTGTLNAAFTLTLSKPVTVYAEMHFDVASITAVAGSDFDYKGGFVVFAAGETSKTITVAVKGDLLPEPTETFALNLLFPTNLRIADAQGIGTIIDNDGKRWVGPASGGNWSTGADWSPTGVPTASDHVSIDGKSVNLSASATVGSLTLSGGASLAVASNGSRVLRTSSLFISGSKLNLNDNAVIIDYTGATPIAAIGPLLASGYNAGAWNGNGINSSVASSANRALGLAEATDLFTTFPADFAGQPIDNTAVLIRFTLPGDATLDRSVDIADFSALATNFNVASTRWSRGDFNYDAVTNISDFSILGSNFNTNIAAASSRSTTPMMTSRISRFSGLEINPDWKDLF